MHFDFEALLLIATLVTGVVWGYEKLVWRKRRPEGQSQEDDPWWIDFPRSLFPVILFVFLIRSFVVEPFRIPSGSMLPTLLKGDFILVNKFAYGVRMPVFHQVLIGNGGPERGDVVVFRYPQNPEQDYIKRVIGLPGDVVTYINKQVYVNGEPVAQKPLGPYNGPQIEGPSELRLETLGSVEHDILIHPEPSASQGQYRVPEGHYFVMGDNRDRSADSRFWGFVPEDNLVGKAFFIWFSWDHDDNWVNFGRIGDSIR